jgi:hypothetical protein
LIAACLVLVTLSSGCTDRFSTDIPINFQNVLKERYLGKTAWTRRTLRDEKKEIKIEQDQEVVIEGLGMFRQGSVTVRAKVGHKRVVFPFRLQRPLTLEHYEKTLLDFLWFESPEARFEANKAKYGTRFAEAIRDHKLLKDMPQYVAYLSWGAPDKITPREGAAVDAWQYDNDNLPGAQIDINTTTGKVGQFSGENIADTEAAKKKKAVRRGSQTAQGR